MLPYNHKLYGIDRQTNLHPNSTTSNADSSTHTHTLSFCNMNSDTQYTSYSASLSQSVNPALWASIQRPQFFSAAPVGALRMLLQGSSQQLSYRVGGRHGDIWKGALWRLDFHWPQSKPGNVRERILVSKPLLYIGNTCAARAHYGCLYDRI